MLQFLLSRGSKMIAEVEDKRTPLMIAARGGFYEAVHVLLQHADATELGALDGDGKTALQLTGRRDVRALLLQHQSTIPLPGN